MPSYEDGGAVSSWFARKGSRFLLGQVTSGLGFLLFYVPFIAGLVGHVREAEAWHAFWSRAALVGGILFPAAGIAGGLFVVPLALLDGNVSPDVAALARAASSYAFIVSGALGGVLIGAVTVLVFTGDALRRWLGWFGGVVAAAAIVGSAAILEDDPVGILSAVSSLAWLGVLVWIVGVSVALLRVESGSGQGASGT